MIHIHDLSKTYNGVTVLKIDELQIPLLAVPLG